MLINKLPSRYNYSKKNLNNPKYIVVHDTGNSRPGADAKAHYKYFNGKYRGASAHYFVDDTQVVEIIDPRVIAWHCGDGRGKYGIYNSNSIGVEICINSDGNRSATLDKTIELIRHLMSHYNIPKTRVVRHYDASRKICPGTMAANNWQGWREFYNSI